MFRTRHIRTSVSGAFALCLIAGLATSATAQLSPVPQFTGEFFHTPVPHTGFAHCIPDRVFNSTADLCVFNINTGAPVDGLLASSSWNFQGHCSISAFSPTRFYGSASGAAEWTFDNPVGRFGAFFGTNYNAVIGAGGGTATFYDVNNDVIGQMPIPISICGAWEWHGWESSVPVLRIRTVANFGGGEFLMMDDMTYDPFDGAPPCYADCDGSETLTVDDFTCFINEFASASALPHEQQVEHYANCDGSTTMPALTVDDFTCFINEFAAGCP